MVKRKKKKKKEVALKHKTLAIDPAENQSIEMQILYENSMTEVQSKPSQVNRLV